MLQLLCLTDTEPTAMLPGLELLSHEIRRVPLGARIPVAEAERFDLILVDGTRDARGGRAACLLLKHDCPVPRVLVASAADLPAITAEWGAADILLPDASPAEIELRLRLSRDERVAAAGTTGALRAAGVEIDETTFTARIHERTLDLTYKEFELLHFLVAQPGRVFTRDQLLNEVWGSDYFGGTRTVDVHVRRLRAKLGDHAGLIGTVRGVGYGFAREQRESADE